MKRAEFAISPRREPECKNGLRYEKMLWLFFLGSVLGVVFEGIVKLVTKGCWRTHVSSVMGHLNFLYGAGLVLFYVGAYLLRNRPLLEKTVILMFTATALELICGLLMRDVLGVRAWNYSRLLLNYKGIISPSIAACWGLAACLFCVIRPRIDRLLDWFMEKKWHIPCIILSIFLSVNMLLSLSSVIRWSDRHHGIPAQTAYEQWIDSEAPDSWMTERFQDWEFLNQEAAGRSK